MDNSHKREDTDNCEIAEPDRVDQLDRGELQAPSSETVGSGAACGVSPANDEAGIAERLMDFLVDEGDGDLLLSQNFPQEALDLQVIGACRADERLKPLLKLNVFSGAAEDRLMTHLNQHFDSAEIGILVRCLLTPLVSIRVGKIMKRGTMLCPTGARGNLTLALLPTSYLRISFIGDDGSLEKIAFLYSIGQCSAVTVEQIPADTSGRSFVLKVTESRVFYFWCSEKSKLLGNELLAKMLDLLQRTPSLADLTGICEARLSSFVALLHAFLVGSTEGDPAGAASSPSASYDASPVHFEPGQLCCTSPCFSRSPCARHTSSQAVRENSLSQGILSPRSRPFKEGSAKIMLRSSAREKFLMCGDCHLSSVEEIPIFATAAADESISSHAGNSQASVGTGPFSSVSTFLDKPGKSMNPPFLSSSVSPTGASPLFSPCYCWCPPHLPSLQCTITPPQQQIPSGPLSLPTLLSSFSPSASRTSGLLTPVTPLGMSIPFFPLSSQQISTFKPLMCDSIVHIPVIDVSSRYLVTGGSAISTIPPLHSRPVSSTKSVVDKGARETLRLLISTSSAQTSAQLMGVLPAVHTSRGDKQGVLVAGSRGLYKGSQDVGVLGSGITTVGLRSFPIVGEELLTLHPPGQVKVPADLLADRVAPCSDAGRVSAVSDCFWSEC